MYTFDPPPKGYFNTLQRLRRSAAPLILVHSKDPANDGYAEVIIGGPNVQPYDQGLFSDQPRSWRSCLG